MRQEEAVFVVDRVMDGHAVLVPDAGSTARPDQEQIVSAARLPPVSEGDVLRVPVCENGDMDWAGATADPKLREERLRHGEARLGRLGRRDPGGDIRL